MRSKIAAALLAVVALALPLLGQTQTFPSTISFGPTTLTTTGIVGALNLSGQSTCSSSVQITGAVTVTPQVSQDNVNWTTVAGSTPAGTVLSSVTSSQTLSFPIPSYYGFRLNVVSNTGSVTISGTCSGASSNTQVVTIAGGVVSFASPQPVTLATQLPAGSAQIGAVAQGSPATAASAWPVYVASPLPVPVTFSSTPQPVNISSPTCVIGAGTGLAVFQNSSGAVCPSNPDTIFFTATTPSALTQIIAGTPSKSLRIWSINYTFLSNLADDAMAISQGTGTNCGSTNVVFFRVVNPSTTAFISGNFQYNGVPLIAGDQVCIATASASDVLSVSIVYTAAY